MKTKLAAGALTLALAGGGAAAVTAQEAPPTVGVAVTPPR
jgi:hypothetical protein